MCFFKILVIDLLNILLIKILLIHLFTSQLHYNLFLKIILVCILILLNKCFCFSTVTACLEIMCAWIHSYIDNHTSQDLGVHGTFHSVCQTVFYIFAFRNQELLEADKGIHYIFVSNTLFI